MTRRQLNVGGAVEPRLFWLASIVTDAGCFEWQGARMAIINGRQGYGRLRVDGVERYAHRYAWESVNGPIPEGMFVCHACDNPPCINPAHLFLGTQADNNRDRIAKGRPGVGTPGWRSGATA